MTVPRRSQRSGGCCVYALHKSTTLTLTPTLNSTIFCSFGSLAHPKLLARRRLFYELINRQAGIYTPAWSSICGLLLPAKPLMTCRVQTVHLHPSIIETRRRQHHQQQRQTGVDYGRVQLRMLIRGNVNISG